MRDSQQKFSRIGATLLVLVAQLAHLLWQYSRAGIVTHHILQRADLPGISNAWGIVWLPALTWFLCGRMQQQAESTHKEAIDRLWLRMRIGLLGALLLGGALALAFSFDFGTVAEILFQALLLCAVLLPLYQAHYVLGFVLAMSFTFGAMLPSLMAAVIALISAVLHCVVYPLLRRLWTVLRAPS
jgi:uncharacterized membrane protein